MLYTIMSAQFIGLTFLTNVPYSLFGLNFFYGATTICNLINVAVFYRTKKSFKISCLNIEWDIDLDEFVVKMPKSSFGGIRELRIKPTNFA